MLVLIRHGETDWSRGGRHTGRTDIPLTQVGREQAAALAPRLRAYTFTRVLVSPLKRAMETAALAGLGAAVEPRPELMECDYGAYEGLTRAEILARALAWDLWRDGFPEGETVPQVAARVDLILADARVAGGDVALVAHGHVLRILTARYLLLGPEQGSLFALGTATLSELAEEHGRPVIQRWNS